MRGQLSLKDQALIPQWISTSSIDPTMDIESSIDLTIDIDIKHSRLTILQIVVKKSVHFAPAKHILKKKSV